jgi:hypothetical protein
MFVTTATRKSLVSSRQPVWLSAFLIGFAAPAAAADSKVILFCHQAAEPCKHMTESFRKLLVIWDGRGTFTSQAHFSELDCAQNKAFCDKEGVNTFPTAVHYRNGERVASWTVNGEKPSMVWQFVDWVNAQSNAISSETRAQQELDATAGSSSILNAIHKSFAHTFNSTSAFFSESERQAHSSPFSLLAPFANLDEEAATVGWCLLFGSLIVVAYVICEGFELWPTAALKVMRRS